MWGSVLRLRYLSKRERKEGNHLLLSAAQKVLNNMKNNIHLCTDLTCMCLCTLCFWIIALYNQQSQTFDELLQIETCFVALLASLIKLSCQVVLQITSMDFDNFILISGIFISIWHTAFFVNYLVAVFAVCSICSLGVIHLLLYGFSQFLQTNTDWVDMEICENTYMEQEARECNERML